MSISVIVPTYNGAGKITGLLDALLLQTVSNFDLIVVIDGSTDNTAEVLRTYQGKFSSLMIIEQENTGRAQVRNRGAQEATGSLLIFYDDDMEPFPDSVQRHIRFHEKYHGLCAGSQANPFAASNADIQNYKASLSKKWLSPYPDGLSPLSMRNLFFTAANCSIKRRDFDSLQGFDIRLTDAEDYDLAGRALESGIPVYFDKSNEATHNESISLRKLIIRQHQYHEAHIKLKALHPTWFVGLGSTVGSMRKLFYRFFRYNWWLITVESSLVWKLVPRSARYKIYDWIIYSRTVVFPNHAP